MKPIKKITIRYEKFEDGYSALYGEISKEGDLIINGCDAGDLAKKMLGDWDYEYWLTTPGNYKDTILLHLIKDRFSSVHEIRKWLDNLGIPAEFLAY